MPVSIARCTILVVTRLKTVRVLNSYLELREKLTFAQVDNKLPDLIKSLFAVYKGPLPVPILCEMCTVHARTSYTSSICILILSSRLPISLCHILKLLVLVNVCKVFRGTSGQPCMCHCFPLRQAQLSVIAARSVITCLQFSQGDDFSRLRFLLFLYQKEEYFVYHESISTATLSGSRNSFD
jgi:hypothetical protein